MYSNFPTIKEKPNPLQNMVEKYNKTLNEIENNGNNSNNMDRALVENFFDIKKQVANIYNGMRNNSLPLGSPDNTKTPHSPHTPNQSRPPPPSSNPGSIFLSDMYNGYNGPNDTSNRSLSGNDYAVRNTIVPNPLAQQQQFQRMQRQQQQQNANPMFAKRCINSSFSNALNQSQFRDNSDVIMMQTDNGNMVPINNANVYDRSAAQQCKPAFDHNMMGIDEQPTWQSMPILTTVTKQQYQQNVDQEMARQNQVREMAPNPWSNNPLNNPANPVWKPVQNKYMD